MISRTSLLKGPAANPQSGWQIILADLALILFIITAAALANAPEGPQSPFKPAPPPAPKPAIESKKGRPIAPSLRGEPVAVWTDGAGAPPLAGWLASEARDMRLRPTIIVRFVKGHQAAAFARAEALGNEAGPRAADARIVVEAGPADGAIVSLAYDLEQVAR
jgi:hypothetical protein